MTARAIVVLIAIWSVIQGFAYGIMSILALLAHNCQIPMTQSKLSYLMYIIFFRDGRTSCGRAIDWSIVVDPVYQAGNPAGHPWPLNGPIDNPVSFRTNILALVYLVLSTIWIITSLMLIVGCYVTCLGGRVTYYLLVMPWAIFCALVSILDVVAVGFFFYDLFNTLNTESFMHHLGLTSPNYISEYSTLQINANILPMPAVIMLIVAGRGFIFWCFNILSIPIVLQYAKRILFGGKQTPDTSTDERDFPYAARAQSHGNDNILENHFPTTERSRYSDPSFYHQYQYDNMSYQQDKYDLGRNIGRRYIEPLKDESLNESDKHIKRSAISRNSSHEDRSSKKSSWSDDSGHSTSTVHLTAQTNMGSTASGSNKAGANGKQPYNWKEMPTDAVLKIERPHFRLPHKSSLLKKLSDSSYVAPDEQLPPPHPNPNPHPHPHSHLHPQYTSDELRGQLPWSYFGARAEVVKPRKSFVELRDDEDLPPVPVPDYTMKFGESHMKFPQKERAASASGSGSGSRPVPPKKFINPKKGSAREHDQSQWSGPEYRY